MFAFLRNVKKAADFFSIHPDGLSFVTERRLKDVEASVSKWPRVIEDGTFTRIINLEYDLYKLERTIQIIQEKLDKEQVPAQLVLSAERTETIKKPKLLKLQNVEEEVKKVKSLLTQAKVKRLLEYRDGELYWKVDRLRAKKGDKAGTTKGYKIVFIEGQHYTFGHVIFLMFHGYVPERVSFVDGDYRNTRIENLRAATMSQVSGSAKKSKANTCGYKGITFLKKRNKYVAQINKLGKHYHLGTFNTPKRPTKSTARQQRNYMENLHE
jgi:hypothetical protein